MGHAPPVAFGGLEWSMKALAEELGKWATSGPTAELLGTL